MATRKLKDEPLVGTIICDQGQAPKVAQMLLYSSAIEVASPLKPQKDTTNLGPKVPRHDASVPLDIRNYNVDVWNELLLPKAPRQGDRRIK